GFDPSRAFTYTVDEPYGVVAVIIPWNASLISVGQLLGPVLAAGNAAVLKPSELAPFVSLRVAELALQAGIPPGTVNVVPGAAAGGDALVRHGGIAKVHFTGSSATARTILAAAAERLTPVSLELGGKSALLIFADADIPAAVQQALSGAVALSGQGCTNGTRVLVESAIYEQVLLLARGMMRRIVVGDPFDAATLMGPVVSAAACERIVDTIDRARTSGAARLVSGGHRLDGALADGYFIAPTAFADVDRDSELAREEIFGPVLAFSSFVGEEDAVELANATRYGLAAYVHTRDARRMHRVAGALVAGSVWVNGTEGLAAAAPFGGMKESGFGRVGGRAGIREFTQTKSVWVATAQPG
ncbi:MAG: aldehyde dehydrogenase family protein, partial [Candidatus Eremiobacteraeota bacterium]|nr:aldehyde dehydrogenase family protein [Candidatus Eremiobacteraeota bacterium]